jgi:glutamate/tyrosine decarboxylase-like PLP-dependent enzyme
VEEHLRESFVYGSSHQHDLGEHENLGEWTLQGTRRVDILKLYLTLEHIGTDRLAQLIERHIELGGRLADWIEEEPELELLQRPDLNIVCFRYRGCEGVDDAGRGLRVDACNAAIQKRVEHAGHGWLSLTQYRGRKYLRAVILHPDTDEPRLRRILDDVLEAGRALLSK